MTLMRFHRPERLGQPSAQRTVSSTNLVEALKQCARATIALHDDQVDFRRVQFEIGQEVELLRLLDRSIVELERRIEVLYQRLHPSDALRSIPGIGSTLAPLSSACWHELALPQRTPHPWLLRIVPDQEFLGRRRPAGPAHYQERQRPCQTRPLCRGRHGAQDRSRPRRRLLAAHGPQGSSSQAGALRRRDPAWSTASIAFSRRVRSTCFAISTGKAISVAEAKQLVRERFTVPEEIRRSRRRHNEISLAST